MRLIRRSGLPGVAAANEPPRLCESADGIDPETEAGGEPDTFKEAERAITADKDGPDLDAGPALANETPETDTAGGRPLVVSRGAFACAEVFD